MKNAKIIDKTMVTRAVIIKIKDDRNPDIIRATHLQGYDDPETIYIKGDDKGYNRTKNEKYFLKCSIS